MVECEIKFEQNPYGIYFAGQVLTGQVVLTLQKPKKVKGVCLKVCGVAQCKWSERHSTGVGKNRRTYTVWYTGREDYLASTTYFVGSDLAISLLIHGGAQCQWLETIDGNDNRKEEEKYQGREEFVNTFAYLVAPSTGFQFDAQPTVILPGIHTYNFSCTLPHQLPTSFEGTKGHIRYTVRVALERPWKFDQTYRVAFTVLKQIDLNYSSPVLRIPSQGEVTKTFCCGPCKSPPMLLRASIPQSGYVPGQIIVITAEISNQSSIKAEDIRFSLRKIIHYHSQSPHMKTLEEIVDVCEQRIMLDDGKNMNEMKQDLEIPAIPPTIATLSRVININYEIKVEVKVKGVHMNPVIRMPITIGTVPLMNYQTTQYPAPIQAPVVIEPVPTGAPIGIMGAAVPNTGPAVLQVEPISQPIFDGRSSMNAENEMPPPTYEETIGAVNINDDEEDLHPISSQPYAPRYPIYHNIDWRTSGNNLNGQGPSGGRQNIGFNADL